MNFQETPLHGSYLVQPQRLGDDRGFFARSFCRAEFAAHGLNTTIRQCDISYNRVRGTLRGLHHQAPPFEETKLVRCTRGAIWDAIVDLRPESATYLSWYGVELSAENRTMLYVPRTFAHGFLTLADDSEVFYQMSETYDPASSRGIRWNDPRVGIDWPLEPVVISEKDRSLPTIEEPEKGSDD